MSVLGTHQLYNGTPLGGTTRETLEGYPGRVLSNIPFADALEQMLSYVKLIKDILSKKRRFSDFEKVNLTKECSAILQRKLAQKLKDPGSFTILCTIRNSIFKRALCDLGASINLMSLSIFKRLGLGEARPTTVTLQLVDMSLKHPRGGG